MRPVFQPQTPGARGREGGGRTIRVHPLLHTHLQAHPPGETPGVDRQPDLLPQCRHADSAPGRFPHGSSRPGRVETACSISPPDLRIRHDASKTPWHADGGEAWVTGVWPGLAVRQPCPFPGIPDALAFPAAPPFGGFFVLPPPPELPEQSGFLQLPFQQTQGKLDIVVRHRDGQHRLPSGASGREGHRVRARVPRSPRHEFIYIYVCGVKPTVSDKSEYSKQPYGVDVTMSPHSREDDMLILRDLR
jgi:hypothetical protein